MNVQAISGLSPVKRTSCQQKDKIDLLKKIREDSDIEGIKEIINSNKKLLKLKGGGYKGEYGGTLLHHAAYLGSINSFKLLHEEYELSLTEKDLSLLTPLHVACIELYGENDVDSSIKILTELLKEKYKNKSDNSIHAIASSIVRKAGCQLKKSSEGEYSYDINASENTVENEEDGWVTENEEDGEANNLPSRKTKETGLFKIISYYIDNLDPEFLYSLKDYEGKNLFDYSESFHNTEVNFIKVRDLL